MRTSIQGGSALRIISLIRLTEFYPSSDNPRISLATTAKSRPASPALAASMEVLRERRLGWLKIFSMISVVCRILYFITYQTRIGCRIFHLGKCIGGCLNHVRQFFCHKINMLCKIMKLY